MKKLWSCGKEDGLGDELRARRPEPRAEFAHSLAHRIEAERERVHRRSFRPVFAASFTALLLVAFGVFGGAGYASSMKHQVADVAHVFNASHQTPSAPAGAQDANVNAQSNQSNDNSSNTAFGSSSSSGQSANGHHGGGDDDDEGDDDDQYRPGHGCGDRHHVHDKHNECHGHHHHHGR